MFAYRAYGLSLRANRPLTGLLAAPLEPGTPDVSIELAGTRPFPLPLGTVAAHIALPVPAGEVEPAYARWRYEGADGAYYRLRYAGGGRHVELTLSQAGQQIWASWSENVALEDVTSLITGPVLGIVLWLKGIVCLHGSAVAVGGRALALLGVATAGKSTTAAAMAERGLSVLADDITALTLADGRIDVQPGCTRLWLREDSALAVGSGPNRLPRQSAMDNKLRLDLTPVANGHPWRFEPTPRPLGAIYVLGLRRPQWCEPVITALPTVSALMTLMSYRYTQFTELTRERRFDEFATLGRVAVEVPLRHVQRSSRLDDLPRVCDTILADFESLANSA